MIRHKLHTISAIEELRAPAPAAQGSAEGKVTPGRMVFYSGTPVYRFDWMSGQEYMLRFEMSKEAVDFTRMSNAPLLADHIRTTDRQVGVIERAWLENGKGMAEYRFADTEDAAPTRRKVEDGIIRQVSMEVVVIDHEDVTKKGARMKEFLATKWQPQAVALVPVGADPGAQLLLDFEASVPGAWLAEDLYKQLEKPKEEESPVRSGAARRRLETALLLMHRRSWER